MKTLEEYAVNRLEKLEDSNRKLKDQNFRLNEENNALVDEIKEISKRMKLHAVSERGCFYIDFDTIWSNYDDKTFIKFCEWFDLEIPNQDEEEEVTEESNDSKEA